MQSLNIASLISGCAYRGDFEKKITTVIDLATLHNTVIYFDEAHSLSMTGGANTGGIDAMNILKPYLSHNWRSFAAQKKLTDSRVALLGLGGTGSYTLYTFAAMGVGFVRAVDFDEVQLSNLSRQIIYNREDIGKLKIDCAKERIAKLNPELKYEYINKKIENEKDIISLIADCDFCIVSIDTPRRKIKMIANNACLKASVPYISGSSTLDSICIGPLVIL